MKDFKREIVKAWRELRDPYRPELHYMRGPGPRTLDRERQNTPGEGRLQGQPKFSMRVSNGNLLPT